MPYRPRSVEVILTQSDGSREIFFSDQVSSFDHHALDLWSSGGELRIQTGAWSLKKEKRGWSLKEEKAKMPRRTVSQLKPGDITYTLGEVESIGTPRYIAGENYYPVRFKRGGLSRILRADQSFQIKTNAILPDSHLPSSERELHVEKSVTGASDEVYIKIVEGGDGVKGMWVRKSDLREALRNPREPG